MYKQLPPPPNPQTRNAKKPAPLNRPSKYKPPRGLYLEIARTYKDKQGKNGKFPFNYKVPQLILKRKFRYIDKPLRI